MNILYLTNDFPSDENPSSGIFILKRALKLKEREIDVTVVIVNHIRDKTIKNYVYTYNNVTFDVHAINYFQLPKTNIQVFLYNKLKRIVIEKKIDLIHVHHINNGLGALMIKKRLNVPYLTTAHGSDIHTKLENRKYLHLSKKILENSSFNIFVSNALQKKAWDYDINLKKTKVIYNGVDIPQKKSDVSNDKSNYKIIFVGNLIPVKRADFLPDILIKVKEKIPEATLLIIGEGPLRKVIVDKIVKNNLNDSIQLTGQLDNKDVFENLQRSDLLILPSKNEGFGCVVLEAQACGLQTVVSGNGGLPEAVGNVGLVVHDCENWIEDFSLGIVNIYLNPFSYDEINNRIKKFTWDNIIDQELAIYNEINKRTMEM